MRVPADLQLGRLGDQPCYGCDLEVQRLGPLPHGRHHARTPSECPDSQLGT
jgi:hypothetical protein